MPEDALTAVGRRWAFSTTRSPPERSLITAFRQLSRLAADEGRYEVAARPTALRSTRLPPAAIQPGLSVTWEWVRFVPARPRRPYRPSACGRPWAAAWLSWQLPRLSGPHPRKPCLGEQPDTRHGGLCPPPPRRSGPGPSLEACGRGRPHAGDQWRRWRLAWWRRSPQVTRCRMWRRSEAQFATTLARRRFLATPRRGLALLTSVSAPQHKRLSLWGSKPTMQAPQEPSPGGVEWDKPRIVGPATRRSDSRAAALYPATPDPPSGGRNVTKSRAGGRSPLSAIISERQRRRMRGGFPWSPRGQKSSVSQATDQAPAAWAIKGHAPHPQPAAPRCGNSRRGLKASHSPPATPCRPPAPHSPRTARTMAR